MTIFRRGDDAQLSALQPVEPGPDFYEAELEQWAWDDLEIFTGEPLFAIARRKRVRGGGIPDILALDRAGRVVVIEVKRDVDRSQLAQALEYAGWAASAGLDELAALYYRGRHQFFVDWPEFTDTAGPLPVNDKAKVVLLARDLHPRTDSALGYLARNGLPIEVVRVAVYRDEGGAQFLDVDSAYAPSWDDDETDGADDISSRTEYLVGGRRVQVSDLLSAGLLLTGDSLTFRRPRLGQTLRATVLESGAIQAEGHPPSNSPSNAAKLGTGGGSLDGWTAWTVDRLGGATLHTVRSQLLDQRGHGSGGP